MSNPSRPTGSEAVGSRRGASLLLALLALHFVLSDTFTARFGPAISRRDSEGVSDLGQILGHEGNLLIRQNRTHTFVRLTVVAQVSRSAFLLLTRSSEWHEAHAVYAILARQQHRKSGYAVTA